MPGETGAAAFPFSFGLIYDRSPDAVLAVGGEMVRDGWPLVVYANDAARTLFAGSEPIGASAEGLFAESADPIAVERLRRALQDRIPHGGVLAARGGRGGGSGGLVELSVTPLAPAAGVAATHCLLVGRPAAGDSQAPALRDLQLFRTLTEALPDIVFVKDRSSRYLFLNPAAADLLGVDDGAGRTFGQTDFDLHPGALAIDYIAEDQQIMASGLPVLEAERHTENRQGRTAWLSISKAPLYGRSGEVVGVVGIGRDVTEHRRIAASLADSAGRAERAERLLADAIESMPDGFVLRDAEGRFVLCNSRFREVYPHLAACLTPGTPWSEIEQFCDASGRITARIALDHPSRPDLALCEERLVNGIWLRAADRRMADGSIVGIRTDITQLKDNEIRLRERERHLEESRTLLETMADGVPALIVHADPDERVVFLNRAAAEWYGIDRAEACGRTLAELLGEDEAETLRRAFAAALAGSEFSQDDVWPHRDGDRRFVRGLYRPARGPGGAITGAYGFIFDMTEQETAKRQAESASRAKSEFLANMSHELRTPLNAILGFSEMIRDRVFGKDPSAEERYAEYAADIYASGSHLLSLINDILDVARIEAGRLQVQPEVVDLSRPLDAAVRLIRPRADAGGVRLSVDVPSALAPLWADERAVKQILINLLSNAVKFTQAGGAVGLSASNRGGMILIEVQDTGIGMSSDELARIGRPFVQIDGALNRRHQGSGMGLFITRSLVEMQGGAIWFASEPDAGTVVSFTLPASPPAVARLATGR